MLKLKLWMYFFLMVVILAVWSMTYTKPKELIDDYSMVNHMLRSSEYPPLNVDIFAGTKPRIEYNKLNTNVVLYLPAHVDKSTRAHYVTELLPYAILKSNSRNLEYFMLVDRMINAAEDDGYLSRITSEI